jgi:hypothetical protein
LRKKNSGFANIEFHEVSSAPTLYRINVRLKSIAVIRRFNDTDDFDIISEKKIPRVVNYITPFMNMLKSGGPKTDPCGMPESTTKGDERIPGT